MYNQNRSLLNNNHIICRVVFIGNSGVGKTNIISRFRYNVFEQSYLTTIGVDFTSKLLNIRNKTIKFNIWDTAGQEKYRSITQSYYTNINIVCVCYDITERSSFEALQELVNDVKHKTPNNVLIYIVGTKLDCSYYRTTSIQEAENFCRNNMINYFEVSSQDGTNINDLFYTIGGKYIEKNKNEPIKFIKLNKKTCFDCCSIQ